MKKWAGTFLALILSAATAGRALAEENDYILHYRPVFQILLEKAPEKTPSDKTSDGIEKTRQKFVGEVLSKLPPPDESSAGYPESREQYARWIGQLLPYLAPEQVRAFVANPPPSRRDFDSDEAFLLGLVLWNRGLPHRGHDEWRDLPLQRPGNADIPLEPIGNSVTSHSKDGLMLRPSGIRNASPKARRYKAITTCQDAWERLIIRVSKGTTIGSIAVGMATLNLHHDLIGFFSGKHHIGFGIYHDLKTILPKLSPWEKELLRDPKKNRDAIIRMFKAKIHPDYDYSRLPKGEDGGTGENYYWFSADYPLGVDAAEFFDERNWRKGICRHKAAVLAATYSSVGIPAKFVAFYLKSDPKGPGHAAVYLPESDEIVDPTWDKKMPRLNYEAKYIERYDFRHAP